MTTDRAPHRPAAVAAVGAGTVLGLLGRDLPVAAAIEMRSTGPARSCGTRGAAACALDNLPHLLAELVWLGATIVAVTATAAVIGAVIATIGYRRLRQRAEQPDDTPGAAGAPTLGRGPALVAGAMITAGTALVVPTVTLTATYVAFLAR